MGICPAGASDLLQTVCHTCNDKCYISHFLCFMLTSPSLSVTPPHKQSHIFSHHTHCLFTLVIPHDSLITEAHFLQFAHHKVRLCYTETLNVVEEVKFIYIVISQTMSQWALQTCNTKVS